MKSYIFIGNEKDPRTAEWGIKKGKVYQITIRPFNAKYNLVAEIKVEGARIFCPYKSRETFNSNWKPV